MCHSLLCSVFVVRLTFSASSSEDERRASQRSVANSLAQMPSSTASEEEGEGEETVGVDNEHRSKTDTVEEEMVRSGRVSSHIDGSFHPKQTSTQVKAGGAKSATKKSSGKRGAKSVVRPLSSDSEDLGEGDEEEDRELTSLLQPSTRTSRLLGLSQLTRSKKGSTGGKSVSGRGGGSDIRRGEGESTDKERLSDGKKKRGRVGGGSARSKSKPGRASQVEKPGGRSTGNATILTNMTGKRTKKSSRKSVAFNPHTTNLGSPDLPPSVAEDVDAGSSDVYDNVPSDEEDFTHVKSRLYSPKRKSILRKFVGKKSTTSSTPRRQQETTVEKGGREEVRGKQEARRREEARGREEEKGGEEERVSEEKDTEHEETKGSGEHRKVGGTATRELSVQVTDISTEGQWFVPPDQLDILKKLSSKSPRSLRRLTRPGQTRHVADTSTVSGVAPPRQRQRKRHELDSTVQSSQHEKEEEEREGGGASRSEEEEEEERESESNWQNKGGSSADEDYASSNHGRKEASSKSSGKKSRSNKRTSAKLTPPWKKTKKGKKNSDISERDQMEESTPVSKKQRFSTPEEDEGMQSGGGMSLSSSEDEDAMHLVRSMGGRRYRRYVVEHRDTKTPGVRRSKRARLAPVQFWRNEEPEYERRLSGMGTREPPSVHEKHQLITSIYSVHILAGATLKGMLVPERDPETIPNRKRKGEPTILCWFV